MTQVTQRTDEQDLGFKSAIEEAANEMGVASRDETLNELDELQRASQGGVSTQRGTNEDKEQSSATDDSGASGDSSAAPPAGKAGKSGVSTTSVLQALERGEQVSSEDAASVIRNLQKSQTDLGQSKSDLIERLARLEGKLESLPGSGNGEGGTEDEASVKRRELLSRVDPKTKELFSAFVEELGLVSADQLATERADDIASLRSEQSAEKGIADFGDSFGAIDDDGTFHLNSEVAPECKRILDQVTSEEHGITPLQLYILARHGDLVEAAYNKGLNEKTTAGQSETERRRVATTVSRTGGAPASTAPIYKKGEPVEDVVGRALLASVKETGFGQ